MGEGDSRSGSNGDKVDDSASVGEGAEARGDEIGAQCNRPVQLKRARPVSWTRAKRTAFLSELAASCNVKRAHVAAEMSPTAGYALRRRDAAFAAQWQAALEIGYERLEMALVRRALEAVDALELDEAAGPIEPMSVEQAIRVLNFHRASVERGHAKGRRSQAREVATQQEVDALLIRRIRMVERQRRIAIGRRTGDDV